MTETRTSRHLDATPAVVFAALTHADAIQSWRFPEGMTSVVHAFDAREGGAFRISLSYESTDRAGKTAANTDTYHGHFVRLVPERQVVESMAFETDDIDLQGEMTITYDLAPAAGGGTDLTAVHADVPPGVEPADNELGWRMAIDNLAAYVAARPA